ncbi:MAG: hypothetical protein WAO15_24730 [Mycobacterium sp.]
MLDPLSDCAHDDEIRARRCGGDAAVVLLVVVVLALPVVTTAAVTVVTAAMTVAVSATKPRTAFRRFPPRPARGCGGVLPGTTTR